MAKQPIQYEPVVFNEFTLFIGGPIPTDPNTLEPYELTEEQQEVHKDMERILRTVQGLRRNLNARQEEYNPLAIHVGQVPNLGLHQDWVSGRLSGRNFGK